MIRQARISQDGRYRYRLTRCWDASKPPLVFIMLNPSTADAEKDDPTIRRCIQFADREDCGWLIVVNVYALRATSPAELLKAADPFGPENYSALSEAFSDAETYATPIVCAWGAKAGDGARRVSEIANQSSASLVAFGRNKDGSPRHPLYVRRYQAFRPFTL